MTDALIARLETSSRRSRLASDRQACRRGYAEVVGTTPRIVEVTADGKHVTTFRTQSRLGRIVLAPDVNLYHASVHPAVRWPLHAHR